MNKKFPQQTSRKCPRCGRNLLLIDQVSETVEGQYGPIITSTYSCTDKECQSEFERELAKILKNKKTKDIAESNRIERLKESRRKTIEKRKLSA